MKLFVKGILHITHLLLLVCILNSSYSQTFFSIKELKSLRLSGNISEIRKYALAKNYVEKSKVEQGLLLYQDKYENGIAYFPGIGTIVYTAENPSQTTIDKYIKELETDFTSSKDNFGEWTSKDLKVFLEFSLSKDKKTLIFKLYDIRKATQKQPETKSSNTEFLTIKELETLLTNGHEEALKNPPVGFLYIGQVKREIAFGSAKGKPADFLYMTTDNKGLTYKLSSKVNYLKIKSLITNYYKKDSKTSERDGIKFVFYSTPKFVISINAEDMALDNYYFISMLNKETQVQGELEEKNKKVYKAKKIEANKYEIDSYTNTTDIIIKKGEEIDITATGSITYGAWAGSGGPEGINGYTSYNRIQGFRHGCLLARIGDNGEWKAVGSKSYRIRADNDGVLQFIVNDNDPSNNSGNFTVDLLIITRDGELKKVYR